MKKSNSRYFLEKLLEIGFGYSSTKIKCQSIDEYKKEVLKIFDHDKAHNTGLFALTRQSIQNLTKKVNRNLLDPNETNVKIALTVARLRSNEKERQKEFKKYANRKDFKEIMNKLKEMGQLLEETDKRRRERMVSLGVTKSDTTV